MAGEADIQPEKALQKTGYELLVFKVLLQFDWRRGFKDSRGQGFKCLYFNRFINALSTISPLAVIPDRIDLVLRIFQLFSKCLNRVRMTFVRLSNFCNFLAFLSACSMADHSNP